MIDIRQLTATDLKAMIDRGEAFELVDVRTPEERELAVIAQARLLDKQYFEYLLGLDKATPLVFQCHHGSRSQAAAEYFRDQGFLNLYNLDGGIEAWSTTVDPGVPRY